MALRHAHITVLTAAALRHGVIGVRSAPQFAAALATSAGGPPVDPVPGVRDWGAAYDFDVHPIALAAVIDHALAQLPAGHARHICQHLHRTNAGFIPAADQVPLTRPGLDRDQPAYLRSPLYRAVPAELTDHTLLPRADADTESVHAPIDFDSAPDLISYQPTHPDPPLLLGGISEIGDHLDTLQHLADTIALTRGGIVEDAGIEDLVRDFESVADPLVTTLNTVSRDVVPLTWRQRNDTLLMVAALADAEILPCPARTLADDREALTAWAQTRGRPVDYVIVHPDGTLDRHHRHPDTGLGSHIGAHLGPTTQTPLGTHARLWHTHNPHAPRNPLADQLALTWGAAGALGHRGAVAITTNMPDRRGRLPALSTHTLRDIEHTQARWRTNPNPTSHDTTLTAALHAARPHHTNPTHTTSTGTGTGTEPAAAHQHPTHQHPTHQHPAPAPEPGGGGMSVA
ncbi:hypothetical protein ACWDUL_21125 [Nocardia niigatensis]